MAHTRPSYSLGRNRQLAGEAVAGGLCMICANSGIILVPDEVDRSGVNLRGIGEFEVTDPGYEPESAGDPVAMFMDMVQRTRRDLDRAYWATVPSVVVQVMATLLDGSMSSHEGQSVVAERLNISIEKLYWVQQRLMDILRYPSRAVSWEALSDPTWEPSSLDSDD